MKVYTQNTNIKKKVNLKVKTFFGERVNYEVIIEVNSSIGALKQQVVEKMGKYSKLVYNLRLFYPMVLMIYHI